MFGDARRNAGFREVWTQGTGWPMYARVRTGSGSGRATFVLVHGLGVSGRYMMPMAHNLAAGHDVFVPDLPGFGRSGRPAHALTLAEEADALAGWMTALGLPRANFLGNSFGCQTIVTLALRHPRLIERAVLVGATLDPDGRSLPSLVWRSLCDVPHERLSLWPIVFHDFLSAGIGRCLQTLRYAQEDPLVEKLRQVPVPVLVTRGQFDPIAPQSWAERMCRLLPDARLAIVPKVGHSAHFTDPETLGRIVRAFLEDTVMPSRITPAAAARAGFSR